LTSVKRDYLLTFATELLVVVSAMAVFRVGALYWESEDFGAYVLSRRTLGLLYAQCLLGMSISVPRYVAIARVGSVSAHPPVRFLFAAVLVSAAMMSVLGIAFWLAEEPVAVLLFGDAAFSGLLAPLFLCTIGITIHSLLYGYLRGHLRMLAANWLQLVNVGIVPLVVFVLPARSPVQVLWLTGVAWTGISMAASMVIVAKELTGHAWSGLGAITATTSSLLRYGVPRLPGDLALTALLTLPATLTAHRGGMEAAGHVGFSLAVLGLLANFFSPIGVVLLPRASEMVASGRLDELRRTMRRLLAVSLPLVIMGALIILATAPQLVSWYLGPTHVSAAPIVRITALSAIPYVVYVLLRSPLDALTVRAINTRNLLIGLLTFAVIVSLFPGSMAVGLALLAALSIVALLSIRAAFSQGG
jgi:O-antigen/teichoic acid export membrane protein